MKRLIIFILMIISSFTLISCETSVNDLKFTQSEYLLKSGEAVSIIDAPIGVNYEILNNEYSGLNINSTTGVITFDSTIPNYSQILVVAKYENIVSVPCVVTLYYTYENSEVNFTNRSDYIVNNEYIAATSSLNYAVQYYLKNEVTGISIDKDSGKVSFSPLVENNTIFTVVADSHGSKTEKTFIAMTEGFVNCEVTRQALSKTEKTVPAIYPLDFSSSEINGEDGFVTVLNSTNEKLDEKYYTYNKSKEQLEIDPSYVDLLTYGDSTIKIVTKRNTINVTLSVVTKFIYTPEDLASIDDSVEALSGYYILMKDIDLTDYLSPSGEGYNDGKGWTPIGSYVDTLDTSIATEYSFKGTFDGNGHVISGLYSNRKDTASFNAGLFGYTTSTSTIRNLGVVGSLKVSSYSGGLVGSNSGVIENCFADVDMDVSSGEAVYRYVGGFVGNNFGTISNCYSLGEVVSDTEFARFAGSNQGSIINCYTYKNDFSSAIVGAGYPAEGSKIFNDLSEMKSFDYSNVFDSTNWSFNENDIPTLNETLSNFNVRAISFNLESKYINVNEKLYLDVNIYPTNLKDEYINDVYYEISGDGAYLIGNYVISDNKASTFTITAKLNIGGILYTDSITVSVIKKIESISFDTDITSLEVGKSYLLEANGYPTDSNESITYHLGAKYYGISIENNILTIDPEYNLTETITIYAMSESGVKSNVLDLNIIKHNTLGSSPVVIFNGENKDITCQFDASLDLTNMKVTLFGKEVDYTVTNNLVTISKTTITKYLDFKCRFTFTLNNGSVYALDAYYLSRENFENYEFGNDVIFINSVEDYFNYFNADPNSEFSNSKLENYSKTFILTSDLDFGGKTIYGIGNSECKFSGKFYGMGHTISNFVIRQSEKVMVGESNSSYYGVGLFASVDGGEIYDLTVANATISGKNFVGSIVGMLSNGVVENCYGYNLKVTASEYKYSADGVFVGKLVGKNYSGYTLCLYYDGLSFNTLG